MTLVEFLAELRDLLESEWDETHPVNRFELVCDAALDVLTYGEEGR